MSTLLFFKNKCKLYSYKIKCKNYSYNFYRIKILNLFSTSIIML
jgi:hypothetical protein